MRLFKFIKSVQPVFTLTKDPMMKGEVVKVVMEQSTNLKTIIKEFKAAERKGVSCLITVGFRIRERRY